jgi:hypothetical protein
MKEEEKPQFFVAEDMKVLIDKIDSINRKMDEKFDGIDLQLFASNKKIDDLSVKVDKIDQKVDDHFDFTMNVLDKHTEMLTRLDQERIFTSEHLGGHDSRLDNVEADVSVLKLQLKLT